MGPLLRLSLRQLASRSRLLLILLLALLPIALSALVSATLSQDEPSNGEFINTLLDGLLIAGILPIITMVLATSAFGNEVEDKTLSYLVLKPIPRSLIVLPKLLASIIIGGLVLIASGVVATLLGASSIGAVLVVLDGNVQAVLALGVALLAGSVTYTAIFICIRRANNAAAIILAICSKIVFINEPIPIIIIAVVPVFTSDTISIQITMVWFAIPDSYLFTKIICFIYWIITRIIISTIICSIRISCPGIGMGFMFNLRYIGPFIGM